MTFLIIALCYVGVLFTIAHFTGRQSNSSDFYLAGKSAPWYVVAFGMIGATLSGVTFISVPGEVVNKNWYYLQMMMVLQSLMTSFRVPLNTYRKKVYLSLRWGKMLKHLHCATQHCL